MQLKPAREYPDWYAMRFVRQKRFVMCAVGKAGTISWARIMLHLTGNKKAAMLAKLSRNKVISRYRSYVGWMTDIKSSNRFVYLLDSYKVMVIRDPLTRLISAYRHFIQIEKFKVKNIKRICRRNVSRRLITNVYFSFNVQCRRLSLRTTIVIVFSNIFFRETKKTL